MNLIDHGFRWKDTYSGVWTTIVPLFGRDFVAYAIEVAEEDSVLVPVVDVGEAQVLLSRYREATAYDTPALVTIGGRPHAVFLVP